MRVWSSPIVIPLADLRARPGATIDRLETIGRPIFLSRHGRTCAVILSLADYDELVMREAPAARPPTQFRLTDGTDAAMVLEAIEKGRTQQPDALVEATGLSASRVLVALTELQLNGLAVPPGRPTGSSVR